MNLPTAQLFYIQGDYTDEATYRRLKDELSDAKHPVFYLSPHRGFSLGYGI